MKTISRWETHPEFELVRVNDVAAKASLAGMPGLFVYLRIEGLEETVLHLDHTTDLARCINDGEPAIRLNPRPTHLAFIAIAKQPRTRQEVAAELDTLATKYRARLGPNLPAQPHPGS